MAQAILFQAFFFLRRTESPEAYKASKMSSKGTLKKFFADKGFGFVTPDDGSEDVFVHVKDNPDLGEDCQGGEQVTYDAELDDRKGKMKGMNCSVVGGGGGGGGGGYGKSGGKGKGGGKGYS